MEQSAHMEPTFKFKRFGMTDRRCGMKIGTDGVLLGAWAQPPLLNAAIADIGAGCGVVALMIAQRFHKATIDAIEIDKNASLDLIENVAESPFAERIRCHTGSFETMTGHFDLIVSNPPFFTESEHSPHESRALARHDSVLSPISLISYAEEHLHVGGKLAMIFPAGRLQEIELEAALHHLYLSRRCDVTSREGKAAARVMVEFTFGQEPRTVESLAISDSNGNYTDKYIDLTKDFYLNF
jgi:tRNA1Val (adenine37-N6)-methyltransferase